MPIDPVYSRLETMFEPMSILSNTGTVGITLIPHVPTVFVQGRTTGYRLYVEVACANNMPNEIFVYQRKPILWGNQAFKDDFSGVASPADLEEYAINAPSDPLKPFYRLATVDLVFRNFDLMIEAVEGLGTDVQELVRALAGMDMITPIGPISVGNPVCPP